MLLFFDAVRDVAGVASPADRFFVTVAVGSLCCVDVNDDNAADDGNDDADDCDGDDDMASDVVNAAVVVFVVVDDNGDDETGVNAIADVFNDDMDSDADSCADEVDAPADDDGVANVEIAVKTLAVFWAGNFGPKSTPEFELELELELERRRRRCRRCLRERRRGRLG